MGPVRQNPIQRTVIAYVPLGTEVGLGPGDIVLDWDPGPPKKGAQPPHFSAHVYCGQTVG